MQSQLEDIDRVSDIKEYAQLILDELPLLTEDVFYRNRPLQLGFLKMLETIGEAAYKISRATKAEFPSLEWEKMIAARHVYVHDYYKIDWTKVWVSLNTIDFERITLEAILIINQLKQRFSIQ